MIYARKITQQDLNELRRLESSAELPEYRIFVIELSNDGKTVPEISEQIKLNQINVRKWINRFNKYGVLGLKQRPSPGRPPAFNQAQVSQIIATYKRRPRALGLKFTEWSLRTLAEYVTASGFVESISRETLRQIIKGAKV